MLSPPSKCLTDLQRETVKAALDIALKNGQHFDSRNDIQVYLKDMLSKELLLSCGGEIFDCCFHLQADRNRQLPSPSLTDRSQLSTPGQEADNCSENSELGSPSIVANEPPITISYFCPPANENRIVSMKWCKGKVSYISEAFARQQLGAGRKPRIILQWSSLGPNKWASTRCEVIQQDQLPDCDVVLAEDHGTKDTEVVGEELAEEEYIIDHRSNEASESPEAAAIPEFAPDLQSEVLRMAAQMNLQTAIMVVNSKRKTPPPARFKSNSGVQRKRMRKT